MENWNLVPRKYKSEISISEYDPVSMDTVVYANTIDARMAMMDKALETVEYGKFTKRVFSLENRALYKPKMYEK